MTDDAPPHDVTRLLQRWNEGDQHALDELMPLVTDELRRLARIYLDRERADHTLQPTALVNEAYLRMVDRRKTSWQDRAHFFAFAARTMRRLLVEHARAHNRQKRGSGVQTISLEDVLDVAEPERSAVDVLALDRALEGLAALDPRQARLVELRFFAGLTIQETAEVLRIGEATVSRDWTSARAWLFRELQGSTAG